MFHREFQALCLQGGSISDKNAAINCLAAGTYLTGSKCQNQTGSKRAGYQKKPLAVCFFLGCYNKNGQNFCSYLFFSWSFRGVILKSDSRCAFCQTFLLGWPWIFLEYSHPHPQWNPSSSTFLGSKKKTSTNLLPRGVDRFSGGSPRPCRRGFAGVIQLPLATGIFEIIGGENSVVACVVVWFEEISIW